MKDKRIAKVLIVEEKDVIDINDELEAAGQGPDFFSVPLCDASKPNDVVTHYACSIPLTHAHEISIAAILLKYRTISNTSDFVSVIQSNNIRKPIQKVKDGFKHVQQKKK